MRRRGPQDLCEWVFTSCIMFPTDRAEAGVSIVRPSRGSIGVKGAPDWLSHAPERSAVITLSAEWVYSTMACARPIHVSVVSPSGSAQALANDLWGQNCRYDGDYEKAMGVQAKAHQRMVVRMVRRRQEESQGVAEQEHWRSTFATSSTRNSTQMSSPALSIPIGSKWWRSTDVSNRSRDSKRRQSTKPC